MSIEIATRSEEPLSVAVEQAIVAGDLKLLNSDQRLQYYQARCRSANLDPVCRPFDYIVLNGKTVLYARKECAEQLNAMHGISHKPSGISYDKATGVMEVMVEATTRDGRSTFDMGCVTVGSLVGEALANAKMKCVTKAKRRATLSLCGLGDMPDESELDTMQVRHCTPTGQLAKPDNGSGFASGMYCTEAQAQTWIEAIQKYRDGRNQKWLDHWTNKDTGEVQPGITELCPRIFQLDNHLVKWAVRVGLLKPESVPETGMQNRQLGRLTGILYHGSKETKRKVTQEAAKYLDEQERVMLQRLEMEHPELFEAKEELADEALAADEWEPGTEG